MALYVMIIELAVMAVALGQADCANGACGPQDLSEHGNTMLQVGKKATASTAGDGDGGGHDDGEFSAGKSLAKKTISDGDGDGHDDGEFSAGKSLAEKTIGDGDGDGHDDGEFSAGKSLAEKTSSAHMSAKGNSPHSQDELLRTYCGCNSRKCIEDWWPWSGVQYPYPWPASLPSWSGGWWGRASNCDIARLSLAQKVNASGDGYGESSGDGSLAQLFATGNVSLASVKNGKHESPYDYATLLRTYCGCNSRKCIEDWWSWSKVVFPFPWSHLTYWSGGWWGRTSMCN